MQITRRQREVWEFLRRAHFPQPPKIQDICDAMNYSSRGSMHRHLRGLVDAGLVQPMTHSSGVVLTEQLADAWAAANFLRDLLDPEVYGLAVSAEVRDRARELLGMDKAETGDA